MAVKSVVKKHQSQEEALQQIEREFPFLTEREFTNSLAEPKQPSCMGLYLSGKLIGIRRPDLRFPSFQLDRKTHLIRPSIAELLTLVRENNRSDIRITCWLFQPSPYLDDARPVDCLERTSEVLDAARNLREW